jgi:leucyl-tRNA synthetase
MKPYDHRSIEPKWQQTWDEQGIFEPSLDNHAEKAYVLDMFPYPSGSGLHVGHILGYTGTDVLSRKARMEGKNVLHPMGWDSFGLPAENYAIKTGVHPAISTKQNIQEFKRQFRQAGIGHAWSHELASSDPSYYRWTQWLFKLLYQRGLAYRKDGLVNWCPSCQTVLANEQVVGGRCERCGTEVIQRQLKQWYFKITDYTERLLDGLDTIDWPEKIKAMQRNWIGKSEGAKVFFPIANSDQKIEVFTTRPDTLFGATYLVLSPEHAMVAALTTPEQQASVEAYQVASSKKSELERQFLSKEKTGVFTGSYVSHPLTNEKLPVWIADYVIATYGTGAVMAVPAHDERDAEFAAVFSLPTIQVVAPQITQTEEPGMYRPSEPTVTTDGVIVFVKHWSEDKYIGLKWKEVAWGTLLTGGVDEGDTIEHTVLKEIRKETGYVNAKVTKQLGVVDGLFYHVPKKTNKLVHGHYCIAELQDGQQDAVSEKENAKHEVVWLTLDEMKGFLTADTHKFALASLKDGWKVSSASGSLVNSGEFNGLSTADGFEKIVKALQEKGLGEKTITYKLRDWLVSRQRFWGAPIPVAYDADGNEVLVADQDLPVELPMNVDFKPTGTSPLTEAKEWQHYVHPETKQQLTREVDTLDTFVCSSWYYLRFPDPSYTEGPFNPEALKRWLPVDTYVGGAEHAVLHLLYARFFTKVLFDAGLVHFEEPFMQLKNQGMILGPDHQKMSKSKGNVINPDDVIAEFGADTLRLYELFMAPFELEKPWDTKGIIGSRRFLEKLWRLQEKVSGEASKEENRLVHAAIKKVGEDISLCSFNTAVSTLMETLNKLVELPSVSTQGYHNFLAILAPLAPHITEELWQATGGKGLISQSEWPEYQDSYLVQDEITYMLQVNGKVRGNVTVSAALTTPGEIEAFVKAQPATQAILEGKELRRTIVVPGKLVSFVVV